jgi:hypothetical protein
MNKLLIFLLLFFFCKVESQILYVKNIELSNVIVKVDKLHSENDGMGPNVYFELCVKNNTDTLIVLPPSKSIFTLQFRYKNRDYTNELKPLTLVPFLEKKEIMIYPHEILNVKFGDRIFMGTDILDYRARNTYDYSRELMQVLPTLQIQYKDDIIKISSIGIQNVALSDYYYYEPK